MDVAVILSGAWDPHGETPRLPEQVLSSLIKGLDERSVDYRIGVTSSTLDREGSPLCDIEEVLRRAEFVQPTFGRDAWHGEWPPPPLISPSMAALGDIPKLSMAYVGTEMGKLQCEVTQYLEAAFWSTDGRNARFPRDGTLLVLLIMSTRDDCSTADFTLWDPSSGWREEMMTNARCTFAPEGLLHSVDHYVQRLSQSHASGRVLAYVVGSGIQPVQVPFTPDSEKPLWVDPECEVRGMAITPASRLLDFASKVDAQGIEGVDAIFDGGICEAADDYEQQKVAGRIVAAIAERIQ